MKRATILWVATIWSVYAWADINITPGSGGKVVHTDSVGGVEYQYIKIVDGTTGGASSATVTSNGQLKTSTLIDASSNTIQGGLADNGAAAATNRMTTLPSIYQTGYLNGTAAIQGRNGALSQGTDGLLWTVSLPAMRPTSYTASTGTILSVVKSTDIAQLCGNASDTVLVYGLRISCTQTTAGNVPLIIKKLSSADAGVFSTMTVVAQDSNYGTQISSAVWFTANPTTQGTVVGNLDTYPLGCMATGTGTPNDIYISPADWRMKPIVLRGTSQCVAVSLGGTTVTGGSFGVSYSWLEIPTITP